MRILTEEQYLLEAEPALRQVFVSDDPFDQPFSSKITERRIIYPCKYEIEQPFTDAVIKAASIFGDNGFYWSSLWRYPIDPNQINHCYVSFSEFLSFSVNNNHPDYARINMIFFLENVIYSPQGKWGIMLSHENFGLLGGLDKFVTTISELIPNLDQQVYDFLKYFKYFKDNHVKATLDWLPSLITHVYGQKTAEKMLRETEYLS